MEQSQPAILIDPQVKESMYSLIEAQRHSHELVVTQLMVALEETHRECRFLRQQLSTSNEMLHDSQLQLRRAVEDKEILLAKILQKDDAAAKIKSENDELKVRVQEDMRELAQVREMVKNAMDETYRASNRTHQQHSNLLNSSTSGNGQQQQQQEQLSPSRQILLMQQQQQQDYYSPPGQQPLLNNNPKVGGGSGIFQGYGSSDFPASLNGMRASTAFAAASPVRTRDEPSGYSYMSTNQQQQPLAPTTTSTSAGDFSIHRNSQGEMTIRADHHHPSYHQMQQQQQENNNNNLISRSIMNQTNNDLLNFSVPMASVPRSLIGGNQEQNIVGGVTLSYGSNNNSPNNNNNNNNNIFRPVTVDMKHSKGISVSPQGHVSISIANEELNQAALCVYRDLRGNGASTGSTLIFEASFRTTNPRAVLVGLATILAGQQSQHLLQNNNNNKETSSSTTFTDAMSASSGLGPRCAIRGDGVMLLATDDGNVFEARSGLSIANNNVSTTTMTTTNGVITVRLEEMTSRVVFALNGDLIHTVPLQVPKSISGAAVGSLVPFVSLPNSGDEVVVRAPLR